MTCRLSVIIPVLNELERTKHILNELADKMTETEYEVVIVNDWSDGETTNWLNEWVVTPSEYRRSLRNNWENKGVNYSRNKWVAIANWEYVRIINNDIFLIKWLDTALIKALDEGKVACPFTTRGIHVWKMPLFKPSDNIAGWCYMMRKSDRVDIPEQLVTRYGDNFIYDTYKDSIVWGWRCHHVESQTLNKVKGINEITQKDWEEYKKIWL